MNEDAEYLLDIHIAVNHFYISVYILLKHLSLNIEFKCLTSIKMRFEALNYQQISKGGLLVLNIDG